MIACGGGSESDEDLTETDPSGDTDGGDTDGGDTDPDPEPTCEELRRIPYQGCTGTGTAENKGRREYREYTWDDEGRIVLQNYVPPEGTPSQTKYLYTDGRLTRTETWNGESLVYFVDFTWNSDGLRAGSEDSYGRNEAWTYDNQGRQTRYTRDDQGDGTLDEDCARTWSTDGFEEVCTGTRTVVKVDERGLEVSGENYAPASETSPSVVWTNQWREDCQPALQQANGEFSSTTQYGYTVDGQVNLIVARGRGFGFEESRSYACP
jgi:hypothetical protein